MSDSEETNQILREIRDMIVAGNQVSRGPKTLRNMQSQRQQGRLAVFAVVFVAIYFAVYMALA